MIYEIYKIEGELPHKFVVTRNRDALLFSASTYEVDNKGKHLTFHKDIASKFGLALSLVLGGGYVEPNKEKTRVLEVCKASKDFGAVPLEILTQFSLEPEYLEKYPGVFDKLTINPDITQIKIPSWEEILKYGSNI